MKRITYCANNSGGGWWLTDADWKALENAGWTVQWGGFYFCGPRSGYPAPAGKPTPCANPNDCPGHRKAESAEEARAGKHDWQFGAVAREATKEFPSKGEAIAEWERVLGYDAHAAGCSCCGQPHNFYEP